MKKQRATQSRTRTHGHEAPPAEAGAVPRGHGHSTLRDAVERVLDEAALIAMPYPEEIEAVERVHAWVRARQAGREAHVRPADVVLVLSLVLAGLNRDLTSAEHDMLATLDAALRGGAHRSGPPPVARRSPARAPAGHSIAHYFRFAG